MKTGEPISSPLRHANGPFIALHFGAPTQALTESLASLLKAFSKNPFDGLTFQACATYEIPCNWKVYVDNYLDGGYHVPPMHPDLSGNLELSSKHHAWNCVVDASMQWQNR